MLHDSKTEAVGNETSSLEKTDYDRAISLHEDASDEVYDQKATSRLLRKMDSRLLPFLALLYLLSFLDRANIGNAKLAGLEDDLKMTGKWDYNVRITLDDNLVATQLSPSRLPYPFSFPSMSLLRSPPTSL